MRTGQLITGVLLVLIGAVLSVIPLLKIKTLFFLWIYGIPLLIIGIVILLNKNEDKIETIKNKKVNKK